MTQVLYEKAKPVPEKESKKLEKLINSHVELTEMRKSQIIFPEPIIKIGNINLIYRNSINLITGVTGVHKSRFIEHIISTLLSNDSCNSILDLTFNKFDKEPYIIWLDTEKPKDYFAFAIQQTIENANLDSSENLKDKIFHASLVDSETKDRFNLLNELLWKKMREHENKHFIVFLDVIQDFLKNFNNPEESSKLVNLLNKVREEFNCTIFCVTHEAASFNSSKAKGHVGSILQEKSTLVLCLEFEKGSRRIIKIVFRKASRIGIPGALYVKYDQKKKQLILADKTDLEEMKQEKAPTNLVANELFRYLEKSDNNISKKNARELLMNTFAVSERTIRERLKIIEEEKLFRNFGYDLLVIKKGKEIHYELVNKMS